MVAVEPEQRVGREKRRDLAAAEIVYRSVPVGMEPKARVGVFVKRLAVELREAMNVGREMCRNPIEDHAEARRMRFIDKARETRGSPKRRVGAKSPIGS